ncbi:hypothetical protein H1C71_016821, partial [Ictidomys tridecemlineatus]
EQAGLQPARARSCQDWRVGVGGEENQSGPGGLNSWPRALGATWSSQNLDVQVWEDVFLQTALPEQAKRDSEAPRGGKKFTLGGNQHRTCYGWAPTTTDWVV